MQHTPQQRQGGPRYGPGVLIGGFYEDEEQRRSSLKAFVAHAAAGGLKTTQWQERVAVGSARVELSRVRDDGCVHFGDLLQLVHAGSGATLAVGAPERAAAPGGAERLAASAAPRAAPCARTTLLLSKHVPLRPSPLEPQYDGDGLRYGQKLHVVANPMARGEPLDGVGGSRPLYLASRPVTATCAAKFSRHQLVCFTEAPSYDAVWEARPFDPAAAGALEGAPVAAGAPLVLVHCATRAPLCLEAGVSFPTDFGVENEVSAHLSTALGMQMGLEHQAKGDDFRALPKRPLGPNHWVFINGEAVAQLPGGQGPACDVDELLGRIADDVAAVQGGIEALDHRLIMLCDKRGDIDAGELLIALRNASAATTSEADACAILAEYPGSSPGRAAGRLVAAAVRQAARARADARRGGGGPQSAW